MMMLPDIPGLFGVQLGLAQRKLTKTYEQAFAGHGITLSQLLALYQVWAEDGLQHKELATRAHLDPTSANWLINQLEKAAWIRRERDATDRRVVRLYLTPSGRQLQQGLAPVVQSLHTSTQAVLLDHLSKDELTMMTRGLAVLIDQLPDGDDLWAEIHRRWDERFTKLRQLIEENP